VRARRHPIYERPPRSTARRIRLRLGPPQRLRRSSSWAAAGQPRQPGAVGPDRARVGRRGERATAHGRGRARRLRSRRHERGHRRTHEVKHRLDRGLASRRPDGPRLEQPRPNARWSKRRHRRRDRALEERIADAALFEDGVNGASHHLDLLGKLGGELEVGRRGRGPVLHTAVPTWQAGDTIPLGADRMLRVIETPVRRRRAGVSRRADVERRASAPA
jgi:hypothetical protein